MNTREVTTSSVGETQALASEIADGLRGGEVLALFGDLGSGKTTFTQGLAKTLGIEKNIISPTYILMRSYELPIQKGEIQFLYHIDLYRTESEKDIEGLGLFQLIGKKENIVVIEWPERMNNVLSKKINIKFEYINKSQRKISIN